MKGSNGKYHTHVQPRLNEIAEWLSEGLIIKEVSKRLGISVRSFYRYQNEYEELGNIVIESKAIADYRVEESLFRRAVGYDYDETKVVVDDDGKKRVEKSRKHMPPNVAAIIFWLKNRMPDKWKQNVQSPPNMDVEDDGFLEALDGKIEEVWDDEKN